MKLDIRTTSLFLLAGAFIAGTVVACSDSDEPRESFAEPDAATPNEVETSPEASLPPPTINDAGTIPAVDASDADTRPPFDAADEPVTCATTPCAQQIVAGENHFCARMSDGTIRCWGDNTKGNLGLADAGLITDGGAYPPGPDGGSSYVIPTVTGITEAQQISAGGTSTCAVIADGGVVNCWGGNDKAQLGLQNLAADAGAPTDTTAHPTPAPVIGLTSPATRVDVGQRSACAILSTGEVWCWGDNAQRELARALPTTTGTPSKAGLGSVNVVRTTAGTNTGFAVTDTGALLQWGASGGNEGSAAGRISSLTPDPSPYTLPLSPVSSIAISSSVGATAHACAIVKGGLYCWGKSSYGSVGSGLPDQIFVPTLAPVESETGWPQQVATGGDISCVRLTDGTVQCAGDNTRGAMGKETTATYSMLFEKAAFLKGYAVQVATASKTVCALLQGGGVQCWGSNEKGELGQGSTDKTPHPTPVSVGF